MTDAMKKYRKSEKGKKAIERANKKNAEKYEKITLRLPRGTGDILKEILKNEPLINSMQELTVNCLGLFLTEEVEFFSPSAKKAINKKVVEYVKGLDLSEEAEEQLKKIPKKEYMQTFGFLATREEIEDYLMGDFKNGE